MNLALKHALVDFPSPQYRVAQMIGVPHTTLSKFIAEIQKPTEEQKSKLSEILGKPVDTLFPTKRN